MNRYKKLLMIGATVMMVGTGCSNMALTTDQKVEQAFEKHLSIYPVKSLEDFYDMEGFRDGEFEKDDKGTWVVSSYFAEQKDENHPLISKGVVLFLNRNDKTAKGNFIVNKIHTKNDIDETKEYPVTVKDNTIIPIKNVTKEIKEEIDKYRFLVQDESFDDLGKLKKIKSRHNEQMPLYTIDYQLNENNNVNQWVQKHYKLQKRKAELYIEKSGNLERSSVGDFKFEINYINTNKEKQIYYSESVIYQPTKGD